MVGKVLGRYQIESKLGAGGMGEVFKAEDLELKRKGAFRKQGHIRLADLFLRRSVLLRTEGKVRQKAVLK